MTEAQWLASTDPTPMLELLAQRKTTERKVRLFACACCRRAWDALPDELSRNAVRVAEWYVEKEVGADILKATAAEMLAALATRWQDLVDAEDDPAIWADIAGAKAASLVCKKAALTPRVAREVANEVQSVLAHLAARHLWGPNTDFEPVSGSEEFSARWDEEGTAQADLLRCIFGNPFVAPVQLPAGILDWAGGVVQHIAQAAYDEQVFDHLPVLADALIDAGCTDTVLLGHLRDPGPHARGCWAVDRLLGLE